MQSSVRDLAISSARVCLFGSRVHAEAVGDGVDLPIALPYPVEAPAGPAVWISTQIARARQARRVRAMPLAPNLRRSAIHEAALKEGQPL